MEWIEFRIVSMCRPWCTAPSRTRMKDGGQGVCGSQLGRETVRDGRTETHCFTCGARLEEWPVDHPKAQPVFAPAGLRRHGASERRKETNTGVSANGT